MKKIISIAILAFSFAACEAQESVGEMSCSSIGQIIGSWQVSLQYDPTQPPSQTEMVLAIEGDEQLTGSFYGSPFEASAMNGSVGYYIFMAQTSDNSGPYFHSGRYDCAADRIEGQTWSQGRGFLMPWTAERARGE